ALPGVPELRHRPRLALRNEDRVVAEALRPAWPLRDPARERSRSTELRAGGRHGDELAHVARAASLALDAVELLQEPRHPVVRPARRADPGPPAEAVHLDPRVLSQRPDAGLPPEPRLRPRVLVVRRTLLGRQLAALEE